MTQHSSFPLRAARDRATRGNGTTVHNASHVAARHKPAATSRGKTLVPAAGGVSIAMSLTVALRIQQRTLVEIRTFESVPIVERSLRRWKFAYTLSRLLQFKLQFPGVTRCQPSWTWGRICRQSCRCCAVGFLRIYGFYISASV